MGIISHLLAAAVLPFHGGRGVEAAQAIKDLSYDWPTPLYMLESRHNPPSQFRHGRQSQRKKRISARRSNPHGF